MARRTVNVMKCDDIRTMLEELEGGAAPEAARAHLAACRDCAEWWRDWRMMTAGFKSLAQETVPEPSWGFPERVVRRLQDSAGGRGTVDFFERAGRRVVWATLLVTLMAVLALIVPSSGPVRAESDPEYLSTRYQAPLTQNYPIVDIDNSDASAPSQAGH
jgi:hypothetical protein